MRKSFLLLVGLSLALLPACGDDDGDATEPTATATVTVTGEPSEPDTASPIAPGTPPVSPPQEWPTDDVVVPFAGTVPPVPRVLGIRVGAHPNGGFDRIAVEFDALPGYRVGYQSEITYDGSGERVDLPGDAFIQLSFQPAQAHDDDGTSTLRSPPIDPVRVDYAALESYVLNGDFEGVVSIGIGLNDRVGFVVRHLERANGNHVVYLDLARP